jgi:hypothetical protein
MKIVGREAEDYSLCLSPEILKFIAMETMACQDD